jgi:hypothetical protein
MKPETTRTVMVRSKDKRNRQRYRIIYRAYGNEIRMENKNPSLIREIDYIATCRTGSIAQRIAKLLNKNRQTNGDSYAR